MPSTFIGDFLQFTLPILSFIYIHSTILGGMRTTFESGTILFTPYYIYCHYAHSIGLIIFSMNAISSSDNPYFEYNWRSMSDML